MEIKKAKQSRVQSSWAVLLLMCLGLASAVTIWTSAGGRQSRYIVIIDAGTTGTRPRVFKRGLDQELEEVGPDPRQAQPLAKAVQRGEGEVKQEVMRALDVADNLVPDELRSNTPALVLATAGLRALENRTLQARALEESAQAVNEHAYRLPGRSGIRMLSGQEEGFYAWLAANHLAKTNPVIGNSTVGALEVGGGSIQVVFQQFRSPYYLRALPFLRPFVHAESYHGLGAAEMEKRVKRNILAQTHPETTFVFNPCGFSGYQETFQGRAMRGTGDFSKCKELVTAALTDALREQSAQSMAVPKKGLPGTFICLSLVQHVSRFLASAFPSADATILPTPTFDQLGMRSEKLCSMPWSQAQTLHTVDEATPANRLPSRCFDSVLVLSLVGEKGLNLRQRGVTLYASRSVGAKGMEVDWALGAAIEYLPRHSCLVCPPSLGTIAAVLFALGTIIACVVTAGRNRGRKLHRPRVLSALNSA